MQKTYQYDAFISYRHLPHDEAIAQQVQKLLEQYRPPRSEKIRRGMKIGRIFRDKTELPTCGDLSNSLQTALDNSRYLIVILSPETKNSKWCMEEIRSFKERHQGRIGNILPVIISGEPDECLPDILRSEYRQTPDGQTVEVEIEPLCCDVRADSVKGSLRKLKTEFLRLAAPMLGCGYDDLYQRHHRRSNRLKMLAFALLAVILGVISVFAFRSYIAEQRYEQNLVNTYTRQGAQELLDGNVQEALMYYASALKLDPADQAAKTGALLLLQQNNWLRITDKKTGCLIQGRPVYGRTAPALAMDMAGGRMLSGGYADVRIEDANGQEVKDLSQYGTFISSARDGSCWTFADDGHITFFFTEDDSVIRIEKPEKISPFCNMELYSALPYAMAVSRERAVIQYGGYLYLYDIDDNAQTSLLCEYDLSSVFELNAENFSLEVRNDVWADDGGFLAAVCDNAHTAVLNIGHRDFSLLNSIHVAYGAILNDVVFSDDGNYYALIYGNAIGIDGYDPGGYFEVYDQFGKLIMQADFNPGVAYASAAFEPGGSRLLVWGSSTLQVWDYTRAQETAAPLRLHRIAGAAWGADGSIIVDEGTGVLSTYMPVSFASKAGAPEEEAVIAATDRFARTQTLESGLVIRLRAGNIYLEDAQGNKLYEADFGEEEIPYLSSMFVSKASSTGYFFEKNRDNLYRIVIDEQKKTLSLPQKLDTLGWEIVGVQGSADGAVAFTGNGYLLYYTKESVQPVKTLKLGRSGIVKETASNGSGLLAVILRSSDFDSRDSFHHEIEYTMELWDLNMGVRLGDLENESGKLESVGFAGDGWLTYIKEGVPVARLLNAPDPDGKTAAYLGEVSCYALGEGQYVEIRQTEFPLEIPGSWSACLNASYITSERADNQPENVTVSSEFAAILKTQGVDAWLKRYDEFFISAAQSDLTAAQLKNLFSEYVYTAIDQGREDDLRTGFACVAMKVNEGDPGDYITQQFYENIFSNLVLVSDVYDDLLISYWVNQGQAASSSQEDTDEWMIDFLSEYERMLNAHLLAGNGEMSFILAVDEAYYDQLELILELSHMDILYGMVTGNPDISAASLERFVKEIRSADDDPVRVQTDVTYLVMSVMRTLHMYEQRGVIARQDIHAMLDCLSLDVGIRMDQVTHHGLAAGLRLGDVVTAVNGDRILSGYHVRELKERHPSAQLTVLRDGETWTTQVMENWEIAGGFYAQ